MKIFIMSIIIQFLLFCLPSQGVLSQTIPVCATVAISTNGLFFSKSTSTMEGENYGTIKPTTDTISVADAKNIISINAIYFYKGHFYKMDIMSYQFTIVTTKDSLIATGNSEALSDEMKKHLRNVEVGSHIYFGNISAKFNTPGMVGVRSMDILSFIVF